MLGILNFECRGIEILVSMDKKPIDGSALGKKPCNLLLGGLQVCPSVAISWLFNPVLESLSYPLTLLMFIPCLPHIPSDLFTLS